MVRFRSQPVPEYVDGTTPQARLDESIDRWLEMVERNREAWLAAVGAEGLGHDPEIEAVLDDAREEATTRLIQVLGLGPAADAPPRAPRGPPRLRRDGRGGDAGMAGARSLESRAGRGVPQGGASGTGRERL